MHRFTVLTICLLLALTLVGCDVETEEAAEPSRVVELDADGVVEDDVLRVEGTATVPDGALITYEVGDPSDVLADDEMAFAAGNAAVTDESFAFEVPVEGWPRGRVNVWVAFQTVVGLDEQPAEVIELYGELGEHMEGDDVIEPDFATLRRVEVEFTVPR